MLEQRQPFSGQVLLSSTCQCMRIEWSAGAERLEPCTRRCAAAHVGVALAYTTWLHILCYMVASTTGLDLTLSFAIASAASVFCNIFKDGWMTGGAMRDEIIGHTVCPYH